MQTNHFALSQDTETYVTWLSQAKVRSVKVGRAEDCRMYVNFLTTSCFNRLSPNSDKNNHCFFKHASDVSKGNNHQG